MKTYRAPITLSLLALVAMFCSFTGREGTPPIETADVAGTVQATLSAMMTQNAQVSPAPTEATQGTATISGKLGYPSEFIPPLRIYALDPASGAFFKQDTVQNQPNYSLDVAPGTYLVFGYILGPDGHAGGLSGGYTPAVACGLSVDCTDHSLSQVVVRPGELVTGIDITDWYAPEGSFPQPPDAVGGRDFIPPLGTITGSISYPAEALPPMRVAFFPLDGSTTSYTDTAPGQNTYSMDLPEGQYHVVAYSLGGAGFPTGLAGGYTEAVPCGLFASCSDHSLIPVTVVANTTQSNVDPGDWYAADGTFPPMPSP